MSTFAKRAVNRLLLAGLTGAGLISVAVAVEGLRVANTAGQPLAPLAQSIDLSASYPDGPPYAVPDGALVHVQGLLKAEPPIPSPEVQREVPRKNTQQYALQQLRVAHGGRDHIFRVPNFPRLWLHVDPSREPGAEGRVEVRLPDLWTGEELGVQATDGVVGNARAIPSEVVPLLSPSLRVHTPVTGERWTLWSIRQGEPVTVVARARHEGGRIVLASARGQKSIVSQRPWPSLMGDANLWAAAYLVLGLACLAPFAWEALKYLQRRSSPKERGASAD